MTAKLFYLFDTQTLSGACALSGRGGGRRGKGRIRRKKTIFFFGSGGHLAGGGPEFSLVLAKTRQRVVFVQPGLCR